MSPRRGPSLNAGPSRPGVSTSVAVIALICAGGALRLWQYLANSSLWIDEAALARNIVDRSATQLLQGLDHAQVAPPAFLLAEKAAVSLLGDGEMALRLFPLLCGLGSLLLFRGIAARALSGWWSVYALGLYALATPLIYFSSHVKQYSSDAAATAAVIGAALWLRGEREDTQRDPIAPVAVVGAIAPWLSHPALFVLLGVGAALVWSSWRERRGTALRSAFSVCGVWGGSASLAAALAFRNVSPSDSEYLDWFWSNGFMPFPPTTLADVSWIWDRLTWLYGAFVTGLRRTNGGLGYPWSQVFVVLLIVGYFALWRRRADVALIFLLPVVATMGAAVFHVYPFTGRVVTFLLPAVLIPTAAGASYVIDRVNSRFPIVVPVLLAVVVGAPVYAALEALPPERTEHLRPVLAHVADQWRPGDVTYVYYGARHAFLYYAPRFDFHSKGYEIGRCAVADMRAYLRELDEFRGQERLWIVSTHANLNGIEFRTIVAYLDAIGRRIQGIEEQPTSRLPWQGAYGYLFDLSGAERLKAPSAETFPVPAVPIGGMFARWACYGVESPSRGR